jgi:hypothetical protein
LARVNVRRGALVVLALGLVAALLGLSFARMVNPELRRATKAVAHKKGEDSAERLRLRERLELAPGGTPKAALVRSAYAPHLKHPRHVLVLSTVRRDAELDEYLATRIGLELVGRLSAS